MATLVQTTPATTRHPSPSYPIVRPSSSSNSPHNPRPQPLYLVTSQPQMYPQQQPFVAVNYDYTRQAYQAQQQAKQQSQLYQQQQQQQLRRPGVIPPQPGSAPPFPRQQQQGIQVRSRSDEALREKSHVQSRIQSSAQTSMSPLEAQSVPRPPSAPLPPPPQISDAQPRPTSADGTRPPTRSVDKYRARIYPDQQARYVPLPASPRDIAGVYLPPPAVLGGYGHQPRYSAEDVTTLKNMGYQHVPQLHKSRSAQQFPVHSQYHNQPQQYQQYKSRSASSQPAQYHPHPQSSVPSHSKPLPSPQPTFALPHQPSPIRTHPSPARGQPSPTRGQSSPTRAQPSPTRAQQSPLPHGRPQPSPQPTHVRPQPSPQPSFVKPQPSPQSSHTVPQNSPVVPPQIPGIPFAVPQIQRRQSSLPPHMSHRDSRRSKRAHTSTPSIKRASSSPELAPQITAALHRKSSSTSSVTSAASAPSQLETASTHSSVPSSNSSVIPQSEHVPFAPSPLGKSTEPEIPAIVPSPPPSPSPPSPVIAAETRRKSLSSRLRRAFSFSGRSSLATSTSHPDLHAAAATQTESEEIDQSDRVSISSTASSASVLIRNLSSGFRKSRKGIIGIFKGGRSRKDADEDTEDKFPFGVPGEEGEASVGVSYATAEGEISKDNEERRRSTVFSERETTVQITSKKSKGKSREPANLRGILKSTTIKFLELTIDSDSRQSLSESVLNSSTESIPSIKETLLSDPKSNPETVSDFAKSLASTLDSEMNHFTAASPESNGTETPKGDKPSFDITPLGPRQVVTAPATPTGRNTPRKGIQFSPRLEVRETWHSQEYDRRGEPATCNRLTAQLAQMIKEELNAFKMEEMVVHEVRSIPDNVHY